MRKQNKCAAKRKTRLDNFRGLVRAPATGSAVCLSSCSTLVSYLQSSAPLSSCLRSSTYLLPLPIPISCPMPALFPGSLAVLSPLLIFDLVSPHLASSTLKTFKRALSNEPLHRRSINLAELFCLFPPFNLLLDKTDYK